MPYSNAILCYPIAMGQLTSIPAPELEASCSRSRPAQPPFGAESLGCGIYNQGFAVRQGRGFRRAVWRSASTLGMQSRLNGPSEKQMARYPSFLKTFCRKLCRTLLCRTLSTRGVCLESLSWCICCGPSQQPGALLALASPLPASDDPPPPSSGTLRGFAGQPEE